jgi:hypothetical protein
LSIIGGYVKKDNLDKFRAEEKVKDFERTDEIMNYLKKELKYNNEEVYWGIRSQLFKNGYSKETIKEYIETRRLQKFICNGDLDYMFRNDKK